MRQLLTFSMLLYLFINSIFYSQLTIKDTYTTPNILLQINDEGNIGSITLPETNISLSLQTNKLYNLNGSLIWNGISLGASGASCINDLFDARYDGNSLFMGEGSGINDGGENFCTAFGKRSLTSNTTGNINTAIGHDAMRNNTIGHTNTAVGGAALGKNISGSYNTAIGHTSLYSNISGLYNTAIGRWALFQNITGIRNTAAGAHALGENTSGKYNTASGYYALNKNKTGSYNSAFGYFAGPGSSTTNLSNTTAIGNYATPTASNTVVIGNTSVASIGGCVGWSVISDGKYKSNIREDVAGIDFIMGLRPVTYNFDIYAISEKLEKRYYSYKNENRIKEELSPIIAESQQKKAQKRNNGFVAQEVEELANKLGYDFSGVEKPENENSIYRLRYAEFVVPLVKAVQEQQELIVDLQNQIDELKKKQLQKLTN